MDELQIANENLRHQHELAYQETTVLKTQVKKQKKRLKGLHDLQTELDSVRERVSWMQKRWSQLTDKVNYGVQQA